jgi:hypothetical protein
MGRLPGLHLAHGVKEIKHSQFVDDTLLFEVASSIIAKRFKKVMYLFLLASRGHINSNKSQIYCWNISGALQWAISRVLNFPVAESWSSFKYLSMSIFSQIPLLPSLARSSQQNGKSNTQLGC